MKKIRILKDVFGQSVVEFALVAPLLIVLCLGIINFGFIFYNKIVINNAAKEGIRMMSVGKSTTEITKQIKDNANLTTTPNKLKITIDPSYNKNLPVGSNISITITYSMDVIPGLDILKDIELKSVYYTRLESPPQ